MPPKRKRKRPVSPAQSAAGASGSGQQEDEGQGEQEVIAERRQVIKAAFRGLVEAAQPDLSPEEVDAVVAHANQRMTMGSMQCCLAAVMSLTMLLHWTDLRALPPVGKEYQQRYKLVNDRLPKVKQRLHRAAEYRRGIDGRARNNA
ncbi:hypothetical protein QJQ45_005073 [Haematococcus lacustris]|nr:hypothetical protein QJQ45_005073 [Haematococcus lacustris]